jgi:hypothetical protein
LKRALFSVRISLNLIRSNFKRNFSSSTDVLVLVWVEAFFVVVVVASGGGFLIMGVVEEEGGS